MGKKKRGKKQGKEEPIAPIVDVNKPQERGKKEKKKKVFKRK